MIPPRVMSYAVLNVARCAPVVRVTASASANRTAKPASGAVAKRDDKMAASRRGFVAASIGVVLVSPFTNSAASAADGDFSDGPDGLRYVDVKTGTGAEPFEGDVLKVNYQLDVDGKKVDFAKFFVFSGGSGEVIKGWDMSVMGAGDMPPMKIGGLRKVLIPPALGYGSKGAGCSGSTGVCRVPPDATLEFTIELVGIKGM